MKHVAPDVLKQWATLSLQASSVPEKDASLVAGALVQTSLWGIDSHGVSRLPHYLARLQTRSINATPKVVFEATAAATGNVDGNHGLGIVVCDHAMQKAIELAQTAGAGVVGVRNSSHCGAIGLYTRQATRANCIGIGFTHSDSFVVPEGGSKAFFGTNPISIAIPSEDPARPLCVDMATSIVPWNRIMNARRDGVPVPPDWGVDEHGNDSTNPEEIVAVKPMANHKGYAMAFLIDMLCGPLNGMPFGPHIPPMYKALENHRHLGSLMIAIDLDKFPGGPLLKGVVSQAIREVKSLKTGILSPGDPEYRMELERQEHGIPIEPALLDEFATWADQLGIAPLAS